MIWVALPSQPCRTDGIEPHTPEQEDDEPLRDARHRDRAEQQAESSSDQLGNDLNEDAAHRYGAGMLHRRTYTW